jgi:hypothetical protein
VPCAEVHGAAADVTGVVVPAGVVVVVKVHDQVTVTSVAPVTVAVRVTAWLTTNVPLAGVTVTTITFPLAPPPQPTSDTHAIAATRVNTLKKLANLIPTVSPKTFRTISRKPKSAARTAALQHNQFMKCRTTSKSPAHRKSEGAQWFEIVQPAGILDELIQSRCELKSVEIF